MNRDELQSVLDNPQIATDWLRNCGIQNPQAGHLAMRSLLDQGVALERLAEISAQLQRTLPDLGDPDLALLTLTRFISAAQESRVLDSLGADDQSWLPKLLQLFSTSERFGDLLVRDPEAYDWLRRTEGRTVASEDLRNELNADFSVTHNSKEAMARLRVFQRRETLRIAFGDIICGHDARVVCEQLSILAEVICDAAFRYALASTIEKRGRPMYGNQIEAHSVMIGLGRFGGRELDYGAEIDVLFLYDFPGRTNGNRSVSNQEFFEKVAKKTTQLLGEETEAGRAYDINAQRATAFHPGQLCGDLTSAIRHFDSRGRTWERMSLIKARPVGGALQVGFDFLDAIEPWIYRRYLSRSDISGIRALRRRLAKRSNRHGLELLDVEGGIRDVEFVVRFLQLINGGDDRQMRTGNTFQAIELLEQNGAITEQEAQILASNYAWLRRVEHRLDVNNDRHTHLLLPNRTAELRRLAICCGFTTEQPSEAFREEYKQRTGENQELISRLLNDAFDEDVMVADAETDLVMDPNPRPETIRNILSPYRFRDPLDAYHNIEALGRERIPFLSTRRCRHFLSQIARPLLRAIASTPSPDATLASLVRVSDSLGGKGLLWELFQFRPAFLDLYVRLCSSSPYLTAILTRYPGMIDELMDSLQLAELPSRADLQATLDELCAGLRADDSAEKLSSILHSFKNTQHLAIGVRELLGKVDIRDSTAALADVAEACLQRVAHDQHRRLVRKLGEPRFGEQPCGYVILGMGKLGGREPNYHSDLDFILLYEEEGETYHPPAGRHRDTTTHQHFFSELSQRIVRAVTKNGPLGKLYESDQHLRPIGKAAPRAVSIERFRQYYLEAPRPFRELRELCRARPVYGPEPLRSQATEALQEILSNAQVTELDSASVVALRDEIQGDAGPRNMKRGPGGTLDVEFITQVLQLRTVAHNSAVYATNTCEALQLLAQQGVISAERANLLGDAYRFQRAVEAMLRLLNTTARHDLPREQDELAKLAYLMRSDSAERLEDECIRVSKSNRELFEQLI